MIRVLINGAFGRMGRLVSEALAHDKTMIIVGQTGRTHQLAAAIKDSHADVVVDFTEASAVLQNTQMIIEARARPVIGTSGLTLKEVSHLEALCQEKRLGGVIAPNFSLGAILMMRYAAEIVKYMPQVEIIEMHHAEKSDSPSGSAIYTAEKLKAAFASVNCEQKASHETIPHARGALHESIPIHAIRLPGLLACQQIIFGNRGETLTLSHNSIGRECFISGICLAITRVMALDHLVYGLENLL